MAFATKGKFQSVLKMMTDRVALRKRFSTATTPNLVNNLPKLPGKGDMVPVCMALGMILSSTSLGLYTAMEQLLYSPNVYVSKKKRVAMPEVSDPDYVAKEADKFVRSSFFRRVGHIKHSKEEVLPNRIHGNIFTSERKVESLKSVGVDLSVV